MATKIELDNVSNCALNMGKSVANLKILKSSMDTIMQELPRIYNTGNASEILGKYNEVSKKMAGLDSAMEKYVRFLLDSKRIYEETEKKIKEYADSINVSKTASQIADNLADWI